MIVPPPGPVAAGADVRRSTPARRNLLLRIGSAIVLAPVVLGAAYLGGWIFVLLCGLAGGGILWEWMRLVYRQEGPMRPASQSPSVLAGWTIAGLIYAGVAFLAPVLLRNDPDYGRTALLFVIAAVWLTDICAYAAGRSLGGPLLWPQVSPGKTWSGAMGGLAGGVAGGVVVAYAVGLDRLPVLAAIALVLSGCCQAGDLVESAVKRHFGVKDASGLIPGHGGLMDRLDGLLLAALAAVLIGAFHAGTAAPGRGLLIW